MVRVEYHVDLNEVQGDEQLATLLDVSATSAPFDRLAWWRALVEECALQPLIAVAREGEQIAVLPLMQCDGQLEALANWYSFRVKPIISPGADGLRLLTALAASLAERAVRLNLRPIADEHGHAALLAESFRAAGWFATMEPCDDNHILHVGGRSFAEYLSGRPGQLRTTLKRKAGKIEVQLFQHFDEAAWAAYEDIYGRSWKPGEGSPAFLHRFAHEEAAGGRMRFALGTADGQPVAAQFWTVEGRTAYIHKLAHIEEAKPLSPGTTLSAALFEQVIDRDQVDMVDFGTGNDGYKRDWMEECRQRYRLELLRPASPRNWPIIAKAGLRRLAQATSGG